MGGVFGSEGFLGGRMTASLGHVQIFAGIIVRSRQAIHCGPGWACYFTFDDGMLR